jgi:hypothetical protein
MFHFSFSDMIFLTLRNLFISIFTITVKILTKKTNHGKNTV